MGCLIWRQNNCVSKLTLPWGYLFLCLSPNRSPAYLSLREWKVIGRSEKALNKGWRHVRLQLEDLGWVTATSLSPAPMLWGFRNLDSTSLKKKMSVSIHYKCFVASLLIFCFCIINITWIIYSRSRWYSCPPPLSGAISVTAIYAQCPMPREILTKIPPFSECWLHVRKLC